MFERFTEQARQVVVLAQEYARELDHVYVGPEHLLLALLADGEEVPARVLGSFGVDQEIVRARVIEAVGTVEGPGPGQIPFTPSAKKALEMGLREALALGHNYIGTGHVLLGLVRVEGVAVRVLIGLDVELQELRDRVREQLGPPGLTGRLAAVTRDAPVASAGGSTGPEMQHVDAAWLGWVAGLLADLAPEIRRACGREPDSGDLLIVLACAPDTVAGAIMRELGLDPDRLAETIEKVRGSRDLWDRDEQTERARQQKQAAIESGDHELAGRLRDEERRLTKQSRSDHDAALDEIRVRLGMVDPDSRGEGQPL